VLRKRWVWLGVAALAVVAVAAGAWASRNELAYAQIATAYAAKQTCSCLYVSGRSLDSCLGDFPADARENVTVTQSGETIRATVLFGAISVEAVHQDGYGCRIAS
jgi:hypothetical protein